MLFSVTDYMIGAHSYHDKGETGMESIFSGGFMREVAKW